jgi:anti-sigma factor RsiW
MTTHENKMDHLSESDLHAYIDGELDATTLLEIEHWLAENPNDAAKVHAFKLQKIQMHQLYDDGLTADIPEGVQDLLADKPVSSWLPGWRQMAAGIALFVIGGVSGWGYFTMDPMEHEAGGQFARQALNAHVVYANDIARPVEMAAMYRKDMVSWLSDRLRHKLMIPNIAGAGFKLIGGRQVTDQSSPAALLMYEDKRARRVTLYVRSGATFSDTKFRFIAEKGMVAFYWTNGPLSYALSGEMPRGDLLDLANMVFKDISAKSS